MLRTIQMAAEGLLVAVIGIYGVSGTFAQSSGQAPNGAKGQSSSAQTSATEPASQNQAQTTQSQATSLAAGTALNAELSRTVDSKKVKPGDEVTAQTTEPVKIDG